MTNRIPDTNGWIEVKNNPLSKVGVFPFKGASTGDPNAEPNKFYAVLRSEDELSNEETVQSARLLPWTNDHPSRLLGSDERGRVLPEDKGVEGVTGEDTYYRDGTLYGNIKVFSQSMADDIDSGKTELSMGYDCKFLPDSGTWNGEPYQYRQTNIRFNHLSLVNKGRMGADVAVLDSSEENPLTNHAKGETDMENDEKKPDLRELGKTAIEALTAFVNAVGGGEEQTQETPLKQNAPPEDAKLDAGNLGEGEVKADGEVKTPESDEGESSEEEGSQSDRLNAIAMELANIAKEEGKEAKGTEGMDSADPPLHKSSQETFKDIAMQMSVRDKLAKEIKPFVGAFDHSEMTVQEVARYGVNKLNIKTNKGQEISILQGYLKDRPLPVPATSAMDSKCADNVVTRYIEGGK